MVLEYMADKNYEYYLNKIVDDITFCVDNVKNISLEEFCADIVLNNAICFRFIMISENGRKISDEIKEKYADIPWHQIHGLRNRIVHDYGSVQLNIVYDAAKKDLPDLLDKFTHLEIK